MKKNLLLFTCTLVVGLMALEIGFRLMIKDQPLRGAKDHSGAWVETPERVWTEYHEQLGWTHQKNRQAVMKTPYFEIPVQTNSKGLRGSREYPKKVPEGHKRVLLLGDSFTFGFGVNEEEHFGALLEAGDPRMEAPNAGIPGYGIDQIYLLFEELKHQIESDYVLIGIFPEQFWRATRAFDDTGHGKPYFKLNGRNELELMNVPVPEPYSRRSGQFPDLIESRDIDQLFRKSVVYSQLRRGLTRLGKNLKLIDPETTEEWVVGRRILNRLLDAIRKQGSEPVIVIIPPDRWAKSDRKTSLRKSIERFAGREQVKWLDLTPEFQNKIRQGKLTDYYIEHDWHWTPQGHQVAAQAIIEFLITQGQR